MKLCGNVWFDINRAVWRRGPRGPREFGVFCYRLKAGWSSRRHIREHKVRKMWQYPCRAARHAMDKVLSEVLKLLDFIHSNPMAENSSDSFGDKEKKP